MSTSFDSVAIQSLPLNTNFDNLALLAPGVVQTHDAGFSNSNGVGISANGQRGRSNNFEIDGQDNNDNNVGGPQVFFGSADAISEIQIITDNFGAQYGRNMGSVVNYVTKSGTNSLPWHRLRILRGLLAELPSKPAEESALRILRAR